MRLAQNLSLNYSSLCKLLSQEAWFRGRRSQIKQAFASKVTEQTKHSQERVNIGLSADVLME